MKQIEKCPTDGFFLEGGEVIPCLVLFTNKIRLNLLNNACDHLIKVIWFVLLIRYYFVKYHYYSRAPYVGTLRCCHLLDWRNLHHPSMFACHPNIASSLISV